MRQAALAAVAALTLSIPSHAQAQDQNDPTYLPNTGRELLDLIAECSDDSCMSYVSGVIGGISIYAILAERPSPFCAGSSIETVEIRDAIVETIEATPALQDRHPAVGILAAFGRYWPCMTADDMRDLQQTSARSVDPSVIDRIERSDGAIASLGPDDAPAERRMIVFHDPNCPACQRFRAETDALAAAGWRIDVYPVASSSEESAGYGAVALALRDSDPDVASAIYAATPETADFATAMEIASEAGVGTNEIMRAIATTGAYVAVEDNTRILAEIGAEGTPAWIVGGALYTGFLSAPAIRNITSGGNARGYAPSPQGPATQAQMEQ